MNFSALFGMVIILLYFQTHITFPLSILKFLYQTFYQRCWITSIRIFITGYLELGIEVSSTINEESSDSSHITLAGSNYGNYDYFGSNEIVTKGCLLSTWFTGSLSPPPKFVSNDEDKNHFRQLGNIISVICFVYI